MQSKTKLATSGGVSNHFAATFLEAQKVRPDKGDKSTATHPDTPLTYNMPSSVITTQTSPPLCLFASNCNILSDSSLVKEPKFGSDKHLTKTLHLQNLAADSQPSIPSSISDLSSLSRNSEPPTSFAPWEPSDKNKISTLPAKTAAPGPRFSTIMDDGKGNSLGKSRFTGKRKTPFHKDIRRTQSEAQVNKTKSTKPSGGSFGSLKRALSPFIFRKKKDTKQDDEPSTEVMKKVTDRDSVHSVPIVMETGFPATSTSDLNTGSNDMLRYGSACVRGLVSPLVHPRNAINLPSVPRGSLILEESYSGQGKGESKLTRKRAPLSQNGSPCLATKTTQSNSPASAPRLDSVKQKSVSSNLDSVKPKSITPNQDSFRQERRKSSTPNTESVKSNSSTPSIDLVKQPATSSPTRFSSSTVNFSEDLRHVTESLVKPRAIKAFQLQNTAPPVKKCSECNNPLSREDKGSTEMQDILKRYSPPKQTNFGSATLHRKLREIKKELEEYKLTEQDNQRIGEIRDKRISDSLRSGSAMRDHYTDELEVFYKTDEEIFNTTIIKPAEDDYYKEIEVRINPEGIAVVRRRHRLLPEFDRSKEAMRRSTIHVDDRVFCDKAVLQSIYGHSPSHVTRNKPTFSEITQDKSCQPGAAKGVTLRPFLHQKSVPNLHDSAYSDSEQDSFTDLTKNTLVPATRCEETARLKREYHRSNASNLPLHKKYIRAYTKFYEQKLALKLLDLNRFIKEEKETKHLLDQRIRKSLLENDELLRTLNSAKQDILHMIEVIETPV